MHGTANTAASDLCLMLWHLVFVQIVFSGVFLLTPGKEAYRLKASNDKDDMPLLSSPTAGNLSRATSLHV